MNRTRRSLRQSAAILERHADETRLQLDTAALAGGSKPRRINAGDAVLSGGINLFGVVEIVMVPYLALTMKPEAFGKFLVIVFAFGCMMLNVFYNELLKLS